MKEGVSKGDESEKKRLGGKGGLPNLLDETGMGAELHKGRGDMNNFAHRKDGGSYGVTVRLSGVVRLRLVGKLR